MGTDHPAQPEPRRDGHSQGHPESSADDPDEQFVGLNMPQIDPAVEDVMLVELLSMMTGTVPPGGDGAFVVAEGGDDGLEWASVAHQRENQSHQIGGDLEAIERGIMSGDKGTPAGGAAVAPLLLAVDTDIASSELPPCEAVGVVAELSERVHRVFITDQVWRPSPW